MKTSKKIWIGVLTVVALGTLLGISTFKKQRAAAAADVQPKYSLVPATVWKHLDDDNKKNCAELAYKKLKDSGQTYSYRTTSKDPLLKKDIWIADTHFRITRPYIVRVNYGSGWLTEVPGIYVWLQAEMPDLQPIKEPGTDDRDVQIRMICHASKKAGLHFPLNSTEIDNGNEKFTYNHPEIGLVGKSKFDSDVATVSYFPMEDRIKNFNGLPLKFVCDRRYPFENIRNQKAKSYCSSNFMFNDHVSVGYSFQISQLQNWSMIDKQVIQLIQSFLVEEK